MIEVEHLTKTYGTFSAVRDISFSVKRGEVVGFLGPNGAGKSTTLRILAGFLGMTSGTVKIAGHDIVQNSEQARASVGYMPEASPLYPEMRVEEYLRYRAELKGVPRKQRVSNIESAMKDARVDDMSDVLIGNLSKGYKQRVGLADALVARPPILILDEPTAGLDPNQIREVRNLIRSLGEQHTVLLSTHILPEVESVCSRAVVIARGKLVAEGTLDSLRSIRRSAKARMVIRADKSNNIDELKSAIEKMDSVNRLESDKEDAPPKASSGVHTFDIIWKKKTEDTGQALEDVIQMTVQKGWRIREASPAKASLDEVFAQLTTTEQPAESGSEQEGT